MKAKVFSILTALAMITCMVPISASAVTIPDVNWKAVPIVRQDTKNAGFSGGEGCQWPQAIVSSEADPNFMIFCTDVGGTYVSYDRGENWQPSNVGLDSNGCGSPTIDPRNANRVLMFGGNGDVFPSNGLYLSKDKAKTWEKVIDNPIKGYRNFKTQIAYDPTSYNASLGYCTVAYWSAEGYTKPWWMGGGDIPAKLYKTTDGGDNWAEIANSSTYAYSWLEVSSTGILYSGNSSGLYRSTNGAADFTKIMDAKTVTNGSTQDQANLQGITGLEVVGTTVYASMFDGLYVSTNNGDSFTQKECLNGPSTLGFQRLTVSKINPNYMMMSNNEGYENQINYYTKDGGSTWLKSTLNSANSFFSSNNRQGLFTYDTQNPEYVWSVGGDYISRSNNGGKNFEYYSNGYTGIMMGGLMSFNPQHPNLVLIASQDYNAVYSTDYGKTFKYVLVSGNGWGGYCYGAYPVDEQTLVVGNRDSWGGDTQIKVSRDGGTTWQPSGIYTSGIPSIFGDQQNSDIIFAYNYRSIDKGYNWNQMTGCDAVLTYNPVNNDLYGVKGSTVVKSSDSGATWQPAATFSGTIEDIAYDHVRNRIYAVSGMNLYASDNGGAAYNMTSRMPVDQMGSYRIRTIAVDSNNTNTLYCGGAGNTYISDTGTMRSLDGGATWHSITKSARGISSPWTDNSVDGGREPVSLRVNPYTSDLYVGTCCLGMWKLPSDNSVNDSVTLNRNAAFIKINETTKLTASVIPSTITSVSWSSSNTSVATVSTSGVVTGLKSGTATITAQATIDGTSYSDTCSVTVQKPDFAFTNMSTDCEIGDTVYASAVAATTASQPSVTYSISTVPSTGVASINSSTGAMSIQGKGKITVTASASIGTVNESLTQTKVFTARDYTTGDTLYRYQGDVPWGIAQDYILKDANNNDAVISGDYQIRFSMKAGDNGYQHTKFKFAYTDANNYAYVRANCGGDWTGVSASVKVGYVSNGTDTVLANLPLNGNDYAFYYVNLYGTNIEVYRYVGTERQDIYSSSSFPISSTGKMAGYRSNDGYWSHKLDTVVVKAITDISTDPYEQIPIGGTMYSYAGNVPWGINQDYVFKDASNNDVILSGAYQINFNMRAGDNGYQYTSFKFAYTDANNYAFIKANCCAGWGDPTASVRFGYVSNGTTTTLANLPLNGNSLATYYVNFRAGNIEVYRMVGSTREDIYSSDSFSLSSTGKMAAYRSNDGYSGHSMSNIVVTKISPTAGIQTGDTLYSYTGGAPWGINQDYVFKDTNNNDVSLSGDYQINFNMRAGDNGYQCTMFKFAYTDANNYAFIRANCCAGWGDPAASVKFGYVSNGTTTTLANLPLDGNVNASYVVNRYGNKIEVYRMAGTTRENIYTSDSFPISSTGKMAAFRSNDGYGGHSMSNIVVKRITSY